MLINNILFFTLFGFVTYALIQKHHYNLYATLQALIVACLLITMIIGDALKETYSRFDHSTAFKNICNILLLIFIGIFLLFYPVKFALLGDLSSIQDNKNHSRNWLAAFLNSYPNTTFDYLALDDGLLYFNILNKHPFVGKYSMLWWYDVIMKKKSPQKDRDFFINGLASKINQAKPHFMIVQLIKNEDCAVFVKPISAKYKKFILNEKCIEKINTDPNFDFANIFSQNANFKKAWENYRFLKDITHESQTYYKIYERVSITHPMSRECKTI
jgi:hypothetical protein